jgi:hypothetical protein
MRQRACEELLATEISYCESLQVCLDAFQKPLLENGLISAQDTAKVFSNIQVILRLNNEFVLGPLKQRMQTYDDSTTQIVDLFTDVWSRVCFAFARAFRETFC